MDWWYTKDGDVTCLALYERHYSAYRYRDGRKRSQFVGPGEKVILRTASGDAVFAWRKFIDDTGQAGVNCAVFRNEGEVKSSELIRQADAIADCLWPDLRHYTYVDPKKVRSGLPGSCFIAAGWRYVRKGKHRARTKSGLLILERLPNKQQPTERISPVLTLELPATDIPLPTSATDLSDEQAGSGSFAVDSFNSAQAAADLLDQGEAELEPVNDAIDETTGPTDVGGDLETTLEAVTQQADSDPPAEGGKKKRGRKKKGEQPVESEAGLDTQPTSQDTPPAAAASPAEPQVEQVKPVEPQPLPPLPVIANKTRSQEIAETEGKCLECFMQVADTEAGIENLKAQLKWLRETMATLAGRLHSLRNDAEYQPPLPLLDSPPAAANNEPASTVTPVSSPAIPADFYPDAWKSASVEELGLPPKLAEKLSEDGLDTIGRLEDRRAEISQGREKWPKGIGAAKVTIIEDAVIKWLTANRDSQIFKPEAVAEVAAKVIQPAAIDPSATKPLGFVGQWEDLSAEAQRAFIIDRAAAINNGEENCLARKHPETEKFYDAGYCSYSEEVDGEKTKLTDCVYVPGVEQDDWLRGFMAAKKVDQYEPGEAVKPVSAESLATDLYDLNDL